MERDESERRLDESERRLASQKAKRGVWSIWLGQLPAFITAIAAIVALFYTGQGLRLNAAQATAQDHIAESGQITDRFNAAIADLGSGTETIRLGGIYAFQQLMTDTPSNQRTIVQVLANFVRQCAPREGARAANCAAPTPAPPSHPGATLVGQPPHRPALDIQTALTVLGSRDSTYDGFPLTDVVDLSDTDLSGANFFRANLRGAYFYDSNLTGAVLTDADLRNAWIQGSDLTRADLNHAQLGVTYIAGNLTNADLSYSGFSFDSLGPDSILNGTILVGTSMCSGTNPTQPGGYQCHF